MFRHLFAYNFKVLLRSKEGLFWSLLFPIILSTLFYFAFGNLANADSFNTISIGVTDSSLPVYTALAKVSDIDGVPGQKDLFRVSVVSREEAERLLQQGDIAGYLDYGDQVRLVVADSKIEQTIMKHFLDAHLQIGSTVGNIIAQNPQAIDEGLAEDIYSRGEYLKEVPVSKGANNDNSIISYYALLAMTCLMGSSIAVDEIIKLQANLSARAARLNVTPVPKFRIFLCNISTAILFQLIVILVVLAYVMFVLGVDFGDRMGYVTLTCVVGGITGVFFGTAISVGVKSNGMKYAIAIGGTMLSCFLSGMMAVNMKYIVQKYVPILGYLSPANLISDAFYSLYFFDGLDRYLTNMAVLCVMAALFCTATCLVLRRKSYASL